MRMRSRTVSSLRASRGGLLRRRPFLNVTEKLEEGNGVYVTDDPLEQEALDNYGYVKRVSLEEAEKAHKSYRAGGKAQEPGCWRKDKD